MTVQHVAALLVGVYLAVMAPVAHLRTVGDYLKETDFYHYYAPDADRLGAGLAPSNPFNGPGYPVLLLLLHPLTGDHFTSGKWLALAAAGVAAMAAARLFHRLLGEETVLLGLLFLLTSADFARFSVQATTDMPFLALATLAMLAAAGGGDRPWARAGTAGALTGLAWLVRYNALFLVPSCLLGLGVAGTAGPRLRRTLRAGLYLTCILAVTFPWLVANYRLHGSPFQSLNHLNVAAAAYGFPPNQDGTRLLADMFHSLSDVVRHDPWRFAAHYVRNVVITLANTLGTPLAVLPLGLLAVAGAVRIIYRRPPGAAIVLPVSAGILILLMALTHWESRYLLYGGMCYAGLAARAVMDAAARAITPWPRTPTRARFLAVALALAVLAPALVRTPLRVRDMVRREPVELIGVSSAVRRIIVPGARIMARKPHLPYLLGHPWVFLPPVASPDALRAALCRESADLLVHDNPTRTLRPGLRALDDPTHPLPWLERIYESPGSGLVVFGVHRQSVCEPSG